MKSRIEKTYMCRRRSTAPLIVVILIALFAARNAEACGCKARSLAEYYSDADAVFVAVIGNSKDEIAEGREISVSFNVTETFKGNMEFERIRTSSLSCGVSFKPGVEYLVFATAEGETRKCTGTRRIARSDGQTSQGNAWIEILRAHSSSDTSLVPPWQFLQSQGGCVLNGEMASTAGSLPTPVTFYYSDRSSKVSREYEIVVTAPGIQGSESGAPAQRLSAVKIGQRSIDLPENSKAQDRVRLSQDRNSFLDIVKSLEQTLRAENNAAQSEISGNIANAENWRENSRSAVEQFRSCVESR